MVGQVDLLARVPWVRFSGITLVLSTAYDVSLHLTENGGVTFASNIALKYGEAGEVGTGALIASGLCLFVITLAVNFIANLIIRRQRSA